jgi:osomolarity two-component system sensor histidine kinase CHK1
MKGRVTRSGARASASASDVTTGATITSGRSETDVASRFRDQLSAAATASNASSDRPSALSLARESAPDARSESGLVSDASSGGNFGFQLYISNINYMAEHIDAIADITSGTGGHALTKTLSAEPPISDYLQRVVTPQPAWGGDDAAADARLSDDAPRGLILNGYVLELEFRKKVSTDTYYHAIDTRTERKVVLRVLPPFLQVSSIHGIFNEWYVLLGLNSTHEQPLWGNPAVGNAHLRRAARAAPPLDATRADVLSPATLPKGIAGVLYPLNVFSLPYYKDGVYHASKNRMALVYEYNGYSLIKLYHQDLYMELFQNFEEYKVAPFGPRRPGLVPVRGRTGSYTGSHPSSLHHAHSSMWSGSGLASNLVSGSLSAVSSVGPFPHDDPPSPRGGLAHLYTLTEMNPDDTSEGSSVHSASLSSGGTGGSHGYIPHPTRPLAATASSASSFSTTPNTGVIDDLKFKVRKYPKHLVTVVEILSDMLAVLQTLQTVHELGFAHNGLTSANIYKSNLELERNQVAITGWDFYCSIQPEDCANGYRKRHLQSVPELLPYLSPELTGETTLQVDHRLDLYSLGIIMYELIVGCLPFQSDKPTNLMRMHILQNPVAPMLLTGGWVLPQLNDVILRLMQKRPEDRYPDCGSVSTALREIKNAYIDHISTTSPAAFQYWCAHRHAGRYLVKERVADHPSVGLPTQFLLPRGTYGRSQDIAKARKLYDALPGGLQMILIGGAAGVGKLTVIHELKAGPIAKLELYFTWKFNKFDASSLVYLCLLHGVRVVLRQILATLPGAIARWRDAIVAKFNKDLLVLFHKVPELKLILGPKYTSLYEQRKLATTDSTLASQPSSSDLDDFADALDSADELDLLSTDYNPIIGSHDLTLNLEVNFRYSIKVLYGLFGLDGLTVFLEDVEWCTRQEWAMIAEALEFFRENDLHEVALVKIVASVNSQAAATASSMDQAQIVDYLTSAEVGVHIVALEPLTRAPMRDFVEATLKAERPRATLSVNTDLGADSDDVSNVFALQRAGSGSGSLPFQVPKTTRSRDPRVETLTNLLLDKTEGCALYVDVFFRTAYLMGLVLYETSDARRESGWKITYDARLFQLPKDDLIPNYLLVALTPAARSMIKFAAISTRGCHFHLSDLFVVTSLDMKLLVELLNLCLECKVIVAGSSLYKFPFHLMMSDDSDELDEENFFGLEDSKIWQIATQTRYRFAHDAFHSAVVAEMAANDELKTYHKHCALRCHHKDTKEGIFNVSQYLAMANHFVQSWDLAHTAEERAIYFDVLVQAGRYASSTQRMDAALTLFETADRFIDDRDRQKKLMSLLTICQLEYYMKNYAKCLELITESSILQSHGLDTVFLLPRLRCLLMLGRFEEGIELTITGLKKVRELDVSYDAAENERSAALFSSKLPLLVSEIRQLGDKELATSPKILLIYELVSDVLIPSYIAKQDALRTSLVAQSVLLMHEHGISPSCAIPLLDLASTFAKANDEGSFIRAHEFCKIAIKTLSADASAPFLYVQRAYEFYIATTASLMEPVGEVLKYFDVYVSPTAPSASSQMEDYKAATKMHLYYLTGHSIGSIVAYGEKNIVVNGAQRRQSISALQLDIFKVIHEDLTYEEFSSHFDIDDDRPDDYRFCYYAGQMMWCVRNSKFEDAGDIAQNLIGNLASRVPFLMMHLHYHFYLSMVLKAKPSTISLQFRKSMWSFVKSRCAVWAKHNPTNFKTRFLLIEAMMQQEDDAPVLSILDSYEEAIEWATLHLLWNDAAWANLQCGMWLKELCKNERRATPFINEAYVLFVGGEDNTMLTRLRLKYSRYLQDPSAPLSALSSNLSLGKSSSTGSPITPVGQPHLKYWDSKPRPESTTPKSHRKNVFGDQNNVWLKILNIVPSPKESKNAKPLAVRGKERAGTLLKNKVTSKKANPKHEVNENTDSSELNRAVNACLSISESSNDDDIVQTLLASTIAFSTADYGVVSLVLSNNEAYIKIIGTASSTFKIDNEPLNSRTDLCPATLITHVLSSGEIVSKDLDYVQFNTRFGKDDYYLDNPVYSVICIPLRSQTGVYGALYLEIQNDPQKHVAQFGGLPFVRANKRDLLDLLCVQAAVSLEKARLYTQMEVAKIAAEDATAEKASFLTNMSHEIRTPFNSLLLCSIFLLDTDLSVTQKEYVETIKSSAMVTLNIIDGILAFSKIEHGSFTLEHAKFSLNECIESALQLVGEQASSKNLELVYFNKCPKIDNIIGDATRFRQVLINLVGNSVKFTSEGHIQVEATAVEVTKDRYEVVVSVSDTGIGIPQESHDKVFGAFSQVDGSSQRIYGGAGLGLAISKKLADIMGGSLTFESCEGVGLKFTFIVDAQVDVSRDPEFDVDSAAFAGTKFGPRALIVDPNELGGTSLAESLQYFGLDVDRHTLPIAIDTTGEEQYLLVFVHSQLFDQFARLNPLSAILSKLVVVTQYGKAVPDNIDTKYINLMVLTPFKRLKIIGLLRDVTARLASEAPSLNVVAAEAALDPPKLLSEMYPLLILLAEDNLINIRVALQHLKKLGYEADHAKDGLVVLEMCNAKATKGLKYDVILLDIQMPRMDGLTAAIELRAQFKRDNISHLLPDIIALTANVAGEDREKSLQCGMVDFVMKPILPSELKRVLTNAATGKYVQANHDFDQA